MDQSAVKEQIIRYLSGKDIAYTDAAIARILDPRYFKDAELEKLSDSDVEAATESVMQAVEKRFRKRAKRSQVEAVKLRDIDVRAAVRQAFETPTPPWGETKPEPAPEASDEAAADADDAGEGEADAEGSPLENPVN